MMIVGGWYDAEDLYGPLMTYKTIEKNNPNTYNTIVMGPWSHGDWARTNIRQAVSNVYFGDSINYHYQKNVESVFFHHFLKGNGDSNSGLPDALMFDSGTKKWNEYVTWPPSNTDEKEFFLGVQDNFADLFEWPETPYEEFVSDPWNPVPFRMNITPFFIPRKYMADDQRQLSRRPDVLVFETDVLEEDLTLAGPVKAEIFVSTSGTAADWVVKLIDVYPPNHPDSEETQDHISMGNYQQLVRGEPFRGRFRESFENPKPFVPGDVEEIAWELQDVHHTFKKGHRLMIQIHSSWFPYIDVNPQTYVENIFEAKEEDFRKQTHRVYHSPDYPSKITVHVLNK
jgi:putative CocE/NonD family hydrolase